jgi:hypothetical protein
MPASEKTSTGASYPCPFRLTDEGLERLKGVKRLRILELEVTDGGVRALKQVLPRIRIDR